MVVPWFRANPEFFERVKGGTLAALPLLTFDVRSGRVWVAGPFLVLDRAGVEVTRYEIAVRLPNDYPEAMPHMYEVGGRIRRIAEEHTFRDGRACLFVPGERWQHWPKGSTLVDYLEGPVRSHLVGHAH